MAVLRLDPKSLYSITISILDHEWLKCSRNLRSLNGSGNLGWSSGLQCRLLLSQLVAFRTVVIG